MFTIPYVSCVTCHMSRVTCHVSHVTCHMSRVTKKKKKLKKNGKSGGASRWRVCYQRGLPRLVNVLTSHSITFFVFPRLLKYLRVAQGVQTLPNVGQSICKMHPLRKISITYETTVQLNSPQQFSTNTYSLLLCLFI